MQYILYCIYIAYILYINMHIKFNMHIVCLLLKILINNNIENKKIYKTIKIFQTLKKK